MVVAGEGQQPDPERAADLTRSEVGLDTRHELAITSGRIFATPERMANRYLRRAVCLAFAERTDFIEPIACGYDVRLFPVDEFCRR